MISDTPIKTFTAHNTSVSILVYKHKVDKKAVAQVECGEVHAKVVAAQVHPLP